MSFPVLQKYLLTTSTVNLVTLELFKIFVPHYSLSLLKTGNESHLFFRYPFSTIGEYHSELDTVLDSEYTTENKFSSSPRTNMLIMATHTNKYTHKKVRG